MVDTLNVDGTNPSSRKLPDHGVTTVYNRNDAVVVVGKRGTEDVEYVLTIDQARERTRAVAEMIRGLSYPSDRKEIARIVDLFLKAIYNACDWLAKWNPVKPVSLYLPKKTEKPNDGLILP